eukprot:4710688-Karenia_brevis.AAC.1
MDNLHHLKLPGWTTFPTRTTCSGNIHHLDYLNAKLSPAGLCQWTTCETLPGWTTFPSCILRMNNLHHLNYLAGRRSLPGSPE